MASLETAVTIIFDKLKDLYKHATAHEKRLIALEERVAQLEAEARKLQPVKGGQAATIVIDDPDSSYDDPRMAGHRSALWEAYMRDRDKLKLGDVTVG